MLLNNFNKIKNLIHITIVLCANFDILFILSNSTIFPFKIFYNIFSKDPGVGKNKFYSFSLQCLSAYSLHYSLHYSSV